MNNGIIELIEKNSINSRIALRYNDNFITYGELLEKCNKYACMIKKIADGKEVPVIIYRERGIEFVVCMLAVIKAGCYYVPIEEGIPIERVKYICNNIKSNVIITNLKIDGLESKCFDLESLEKDENIEAVSEHSELVYVMYTSGTSGNPKGVKIKYSNLCNLIEALYTIIYNKFSQKINVGVLASFSFDSSVKQIFPALCYGHTLCIADKNDRVFGRKIHRFHVKYNLSLCDVTPSHLKLMVLQKNVIYSDIPYMLVGGEKLSYNVLREYKRNIVCKTQFINVYGPTECCVDVASYEIKNEDILANKSGIVPIGKSILNTTLIIRDEYGNVIRNSNIQGELCVQGAQIGAGYVGMNSDNFIQISDTREYRTGDYAYYDEMGNIVVTGRCDTQVKINGNRVELSEISEAILKVTGKQAAVIKAERLDKDILIAYLVCDEFTDEVRKDVNIGLRKLLPKYMIPQYYVYGENLPLTINGKLDEKKILSMIGEKR